MTSGTDSLGARPGARRRDPWLAGILALCLLVRVLHILALRSHPLFEHPVVDAGVYLASARSLLAGGSYSIWQAPAYVWFLAGLLPLSGSLLLARLVQALLSTVSCWMVHRLALAHAPRGAARLAATGFALYGPLVYFDGELLATSLFVFLNLALLLSAHRALQADRPLAFLAVGLLLGLAALTRGTILLVLPFLVAWPLLHGGLARSRAALSGLALVLGAALPIGANALHNLRVLGEPIPISPASGINLYVGNNEHAARTMLVRPGAQWNALAWAAQRAEYARRGILSRQEESSWFTARALEFARNEPLAALSNLARKAFVTASGQELPRNLDPYAARRHSPVLRLLLWPGPLWFPFGLVLPLALVGLWRSRHHWRRQLPLLGYVLSMAAVNVLFFPTSRYRVPVVPVVLVYAALALHSWWVGARAGGLRRELPSMAWVLALGLLLNSGWLSLEVRTEGEESFFVGDAHLAQGDLGGAAAWFARALEERPAYAEPHFGLALVHARKGQTAAALRELQLALDLLPDFAEAHAMMGELQADSGQDDQAIASWRAALAIQPTTTRVRLQLAEALARSGRDDAALSELGLLLRDRPGSPPAHLLSGRILLARGDLERARQHLRAVLSADPASVEARALLDAARER